MTWKGLVAVVGLGLGLANPSAAWAAPVSYSDEATFLGAVGPTSFESFEDLTATNTFDVVPVVVPDFTVTSSGSLGVFDTPTFGMFATDGTQYVATELVTRIAFAQPAFAFGLTITDFETGFPPIEFELSTGETFNPAFVSADQSVNFFGVSSDVAFAWIDITVGPDDSIGLDEAYTANTEGQVPEPGLSLLLGAGLAALALRRAVR